MLSQIAFSSLLFLFISKETQMTFFSITIMIVLLQVLFSLYLLYFIFSNFLKPHPLTPVNQLSGAQLYTELPMKHKSRVCVIIQEMSKSPVSYSSHSYHQCLLSVLCSPALGVMADLGCQSHSPGRRGPQLRNCLYQIGHVYGAFSFSFFSYFTDYIFKPTK